MNLPSSAPDIQVSIDPDVFNPVYVPYLDVMSPVQIMFGGSASGKSKFKAQQVVVDVMAGGRNYLVLRQVADTLRVSVYNEIVKVIDDFGVRELFKISRSDFTITCVNGYQILFGGLDNVQKKKSITPSKGVITDIWIEEATEVERATVKELDKRLRGGDENVPKRMHMTFNPILQNHWIYEDYFHSIGWSDNQTSVMTDDVAILKTTYKDNKFLTSQDRKRLENETDKYYYNVYTLGNWGILGNLIFTNWHVEDLSGMRDQFTVHRHGGDFGFGGNPTAISVAHYDKNHKTIYVYDELYEKGLTNDLLADITLKMIGKQPIVWDSAEPKSIKELQNHGVNAFGAKKGQDSVLFGIQWLQQQTLVFDTKCIHHRNEFSMLKWKEDRKTGKVLDEPVGEDHLVDARRYGSEQDMIEQGKARSYNG
jgi:phage terminase large subunit